MNQIPPDDYIEFDFLLEQIEELFEQVGLPQKIFPDMLMCIAAAFFRENVLDECTIPQCKICSCPAVMQNNFVSIANVAYMKLAEVLQSKKFDDEKNI